ncbi:MAG: hypothetical protein GXN93_00025 [Candidatus Diapherotrites archaeon]|nr:hypothetical protein [Candidatus Diapherotrites archaeon]
MNLAGVYRKYGTKILIIPIITFVVFAYLALIHPGISYGIDFRGGVMVSFSSSQPIPADRIAERIRTELGVSDVSVTPTEIPGTGKYGGFVEVVYPEGISADKNAQDSTEKFKEQIVQIIKQEVPDASDMVIRDVAPTLGATFWALAMNMLLWAVVLLKMVVLFAFRRKLPLAKVFGIVFLDLLIAAVVGLAMRQPAVALALILADTLLLMWVSADATPTVIMLGSAVFDALGMLALMALFRVPLTLQTMTILLMMVGYSIDTDIVLSTHLLKRGKEEGDEYERAGRAADTGLHMSGTTLVSMLFILGVGYLTRNPDVIRVGAVMIFGVLSDMIITWLFNAPVMIAWVRKHASST